MRIARKVTSIKRSHFTKKLRRQRISPAWGWGLLMRRWDGGKMRRILDQLIEKSRQQYVAADSIAAVYVALGEKDEALRWLDRAFEEHSGSFYSYMFRPELRPLRSDPRFADLLRLFGYHDHKDSGRHNKA